MTERKYYVVVTVDETAGFEDSRDVADYLQRLVVEWTASDGILDISAAPDH